MEYLKFIADRAPSIATSIANIFSQAYHGIYGINLYFNIATKFGCKDTINRLFWETLNVYTVEKFDNGMKK